MLFVSQVIAMIETREAIENVEAILDVEGLDGAFIGKIIFLSNV